MARRVLEGPVYCHLFAGASRVGLVAGFYREIWQRAWDPRNRFYTPWLITCPLPPGSSQDNAPDRIAISCE